MMFFTIMCAFWFVAGVMTCGLFWPSSMRRYFFGHTIVTDVEDDTGNNNEDVRFNQEELLKRLKDLEVEIAKMNSLSK